MRNYLKIILYLFVLVAFNAARADATVDFFRAVNVDNDQTIKSLLDSGFDPNTRNPQGQGALFLALREESIKVAAALLAHPAIQVDAPTAADETALMMAALRGNVDWIARLLERGAALNRPGWTPLHYAATGPSTAAVKLLLDRGAQINAASPNRSTPLMMAARYGPSESAELLLARGADARLRNDKSLSAADFARSAGRESLAATLETAAR